MYGTSRLKENTDSLSVVNSWGTGLMTEWLTILEYPGGLHLGAGIRVPL